MTLPHDAPTSPVLVRWMIRRDLEQIVAIEADSFESPWPDEQFIRCLRQRNVIGRTAELADRVVGYMIYELHAARLHLLKFAVSPEHRRRRVGAAMVDELRRKLGLRRWRILLEVSERNLAAQLFFRAMGFRAISVLRDYYDEPHRQDAIVFQYRFPAKNST